MSGRHGGDKFQKGKRRSGGHRPFLFRLDKHAPRPKDESTPRRPASWLYGTD